MSLKGSDGSPLHFEEEECPGCHQTKEKGEQCENCSVGGGVFMGGGAAERRTALPSSQPRRRTGELVPQPRAQQEVIVRRGATSIRTVEEGEGAADHPIDALRTIYPTALTDPPVEPDSAFAKGVEAGTQGETLQSGSKPKWCSVCGYNPPPMRRGKNCLGCGRLIPLL